MVCDTLKPKREGCAEKSLARRVDLPVPEGPEKTIGRADLMSMFVGGIVLRMWDDEDEL